MGNLHRLASKLDSILVDLSEFHSPEPLGPSPIRKSPRTFDAGSVGLGIVAAMSDSVGRPSKPTSPTRSNPIPIASPGPESAEIKRSVWSEWGEEEEEEMEMERSESYTCIISHVGGASVTKTVYFDDGIAGDYDEELEVFSESPPADFFTILHRMRIFSEETKPPVVWNAGASRC